MSRSASEPTQQHAPRGRITPNGGAPIISDAGRAVILAALTDARDTIATLVEHEKNRRISLAAKQARVEQLARMDAAIALLKR